jgi:hypothetical protein
MKSAERIAAEILKGGAGLAEDVRSLLPPNGQWRNDTPPEGRNLVVQRTQCFRWVPYADDKTKKAQGANGRWQALDENGKWLTASVWK